MRAQIFTCNFLSEQLIYQSVAVAIIAICLKTITLQHYAFGQLILGAVTKRLHHRNCLGIISWRRNSYSGCEGFPYRNSLQFGPLGELISGPVTLILHLRNRRQISSVKVSGHMVQLQFSVLGSLIYNQHSLSR